jgi:hypothetical protein
MFNAVNAKLHKNYVQGVVNIGCRWQKNELQNNPLVQHIANQCSQLHARCEVV